MIQVKRAYDPPAKSDGTRVLVDRLWPRGLTKQKAKIDRWAKEISPSTELRKWYAHDPEKKAEFKKRYKEELGEHKQALKELANEAKEKTITLIYSSKDRENNQAFILKDILERM